MSGYGGRATEDALTKVFAGHLYTSRINSDPCFEGLPRPGEPWADFAERVGRHLAVVLCEALAEDDEDLEDEEELPDVTGSGRLGAAMAREAGPEPRDSDTRVITGRIDVENPGAGGQSDHDA
jgi:hypothetical protein